MQKAPVYLWTGDGWGKTTSAFGAALRAIGHDKRVVIIQFMKNHNFFDMGEYKMKDKLSLLEVYQFGEEHWVDLDCPSEKDRAAAEKGIRFAEEKVREAPFLLILDEINLAVSIGLVDIRSLLELLHSAPPSTHIYLTGRRANKDMIDIADYVNEIKMIKGPKKLKGEEGIDF